MQATARQRDEARSMASTLPAFAMFLMIGAAAIAQPHKQPAQPVGLAAAQTVRAATVRIVLPPPTAYAPAERHRATGTVRLMLRDLGHATPAAAPPPAKLALPAMQRTPLSATPSAVLDGISTVQPEASAELARSGPRPITDFSAAMQEITANFSAAGDPRTARQTRSAFARTDDDALPAASDTDRTAALRQATAPDTARAGSRPMGPDPLATADHAQMILTEAMKPKKRSVASVSLKVSATVNGGQVGRVALLIDDDQNIQVRLTDILALLQPEIEPTLYEQLAGSRAAQTYMTLNDLRATGIKVRFDEHDKLVLTTPAK